MFDLDAIKLPLADAAARASLRIPPLERMVAAACRNAVLRRSLGIGAVAVGYTRVLDHPELRVVDMGKYLLRVNVAEELGTAVFFFGQPCTLWLTSRLLRPGDNCVDAGANVGHYTFFMATEVGSSGRVLSFEANPAFVEILEGTIALNQYQSRIRVYAEALWEESNQEKTFYISVNSANTGTSSLIEHGCYLRPDSKVTVKTVTLDDVARSLGIERFRLVKIDVERAEEFVIAGAYDLLSTQRIDFLIVELISGTAAQHRLVEHGYVGWLADPLRRTLVPVAQVPDGTFGDYVFARPPLVAELLGS